jgi:hypothetical protein
MANQNLSTGQFGSPYSSDEALKHWVSRIQLGTKTGRFSADKNPVEEVEPDPGHPEDHDDEMDRRADREARW